MRPIGGITAGFIADWSSPEKVLSILLIAASLSLGIMAFLPTNSAVIVYDTCCIVDWIFDLWSKRCLLGYISWMQYSQ